MLLDAATTVLILMVAAVALLHKEPYSTASGAIVMGFGVTCIAAFPLVPFIKEEAALLQITMLAMLLLGFMKDAWLKENFVSQHFSHPIESFAVGTWVAGVSVSIIVIKQALGMTEFLLQVLFLVDILFWLGYIIIIIRNFIGLWRKPSPLIHIHGIILLSCVATQSIITAGKTLFGRAFSNEMGLTLFVIGLFFYLSGVAVNMLGQVRNDDFSIRENWESTNCIIYGALAITGLASTKLPSFHPDFQAGVWLAVLGLFLLVEILECVRAVKRIRALGYRKGLMTYSTSQWSRIFSIGMIYVFTMNMDITTSFLAGNTFIMQIYNGILGKGIYLVITLFILESLVFLTRYLPEKKSDVIKTS